MKTLWLVNREDGVFMFMPSKEYERLSTAEADRWFVHATLPAALAKSQAVKARLAVRVLGTN